MKGVCGPVWMAVVVCVTPAPLLVDLREMVVNGGDVVTWRAFEVKCDTGAVEVVAVLTEFWACVLPVVVFVNGGAVGVAVPVVVSVSGGVLGVVVPVVVFVSGGAVGVAVSVVVFVSGGVLGVAVPVVVSVSGGAVGVAVSVVVFVRGGVLGVGSVSVTGTCVNVGGVPVGFGVEKVAWDSVGVMTR